MKNLIISLRARGLLCLLSENSSLNTLELLSDYCEESTQYLEHTLKELEELDKISISDGVIALNNEPARDPESIQERIFDIFTYNKTYKVIGWFLEQLDKTFDLDVELRERVLLEYTAASIVQFWSWDNIENAMRRALVDKSIGNVTLDDLRELLCKKDRGEIVWQK
jgi:hypothetical protein